jgi:hypothetical protein
VTEKKPGAEARIRADLAAAVPLITAGKIGHLLTELVNINFQNWLVANAKKERLLLKFGSAE